MQDAGGETLADFLYRVAHDLNLLDLWRHGGADAVLEQEGMKLLRPEHVDVLRSGDLELIDVALKQEQEALGDGDVTAHQAGHWGPCWVLVGQQELPIELRGSLTVVGTGIYAGAHLTPEARAAFEGAEAAFYLVTDPITMRFLVDLNPTAVSLYEHYEPGLGRRESYDRMKEAILDEVRAGRSVCAAFYGHAGVFVAPSHEAIRQARAEGFVARMLPAVSAEDCLFADLGVDPGAAGCQSFDATDFLLRRRTADPTAALILWQVSVIGFRLYSAESVPEHLDVLAGYLRQWYDASHPVTLYEASRYPIAPPSIREMPLAELPEAEPSPLATLYVPPAAARAEDAEMAIRLGVTLS